MRTRALSDLSLDNWGSPAHTWLTFQAGATAIIIAWFAAGETDYAPQTYTVLAATTVIPVIRLALGGHQVRWIWFLPFALMACFLGVSLLNLSHRWDPESVKWILNPDWIRFLPTTMNPAATLKQSGPLLATLLLGGSLAASNLPPRHVRRLWLVLAINALVLSLIGSTIKFSGTSLFMGFKETQLSYFFATFTYRNHWSAYAILMTAVSAGFLFSFWRQAETDSRKIEMARLFAVFTLLIAFTPILAGSRSGTVLMGLLVIIVGIVAIYRLQRKQGPLQTRRNLLLNLGAILTVLCAVAVLSWPNLARRFEGGGEGDSLWVETTNNLRIRFTEDTLSMAAKRPWFGWGLGTYVHVFPKFQGDYLRDDTGKIRTTVDKAHNDWAQTAAELGVFGLLILSTPILFSMVGGWSNSDPLIRLSLLGIMFLGGYAVFDFPIRNLAVIAHGVLIVSTAPRLGELQED